MEKWEYMIVEISNNGRVSGADLENEPYDKCFNIWGSRGWELVTYIPTSYDMFDYSSTRTCKPANYRAIFKRPKE
jgi:hypothetical protein